MTRDDPTDLLISLIRNTPVLAIDATSAEARGDHAALAYKKAIEAWRTQAAEAIAEARLSSPARGRHAAPDAFARIATAAALARPHHEGGVGSKV